MDPYQVVEKQGGTTATVSLGVGANHEEARLAFFERTDFFESHIYIIHLQVESGQLHTDLLPHTLHQLEQQHYL